MLADAQALDGPHKTLAAGATPSEAAAGAGAGAGRALETEVRSASGEGPRRLAFFSWGCTRSLGSAVLLYGGALALAALLAHGQLHLVRTYVHRHAHLPLKPLMIPLID